MSFTLPTSSLIILLPSKQSQAGMVEIRHESHREHDGGLYTTVCLPYCQLKESQFMEAKLINIVEKDSIFKYIDSENS